MHVFEARFMRGMGVCLKSERVKRAMASARAVVRASDCGWKMLRMKGVRRQLIVILAR